MSEERLRFVEYPPTPPDQLITLLDQPDIKGMVDDYQRQLIDLGVVDLYKKTLGQGEDYEKSDARLRDIARVLFLTEEDDGIEHSGTMADFMNDFAEKSIQNRVSSKQTLHLELPILPTRVLTPPVNLESSLGHITPFLSFGLIKVDPATGKTIPAAHSQLFTVDYYGSVRQSWPSYPLNEQQTELIKSQHEGLNEVGIVIPYS